jgi:lysozyme
MPRLDGIDVSKWQGAIDWGAVSSEGLSWVAARVWDRDTGAPDETWPANRAGMAFARHRLGYFWLLPGQGALGAQQFLETVGTLAAGEGAMLDAEQDGITEQDCLDWLAPVEAATGRPAAVYTGGYVAGGTIWTSSRIYDGTRPRIFAAYCDEGEARGHAQGIAWDVWQYSNEGSMFGVPALVDLDQVDNPAAFDSCCGLTCTIQTIGASPMLVLFTITDAANPTATYVSDGMHYRWIPNSDAFNALYLFMTIAGLPNQTQQCAAYQVGWAGGYLDEAGNPAANPYL